MANWIIAGLGNPGPQYEHTRHNVGYWWLDQLAQDAGLSFKTENRFHGQLAQYHQGTQKVHLIKPLTFMNRSGQAVGALAQFFKIPPENILVIHDELDLPAGTVRLKRNGGHGGHNGLRDIVSHLGSKDFLRVRLGIDHPGNSRQVSNYVLSKPSPDERIAMLNAIDNSLRVLPDVLDGHLDKAMHWLHSQ